MLGYELKKLFGRKEIIAFLLLIVVVTVYCMIEMCRATINSNIAKSVGFDMVAFDRYLEIHGVHRLAILWISVVAVASIFPVEVKNNMSEIMMTSKYGKSKLAFTKITAALIISGSMFILLLLASMLGYFVNFGFDFGIPITEGWELEYTIDPDIKTYGDKMLREILTDFVQVNFMVLLSLLISTKNKKAFSSVIVIFIFSFGIAFIPKLNPVIDVFVNLSPMCFSGRVPTYQEVFSLGSLSVTQLDIGFVVYIILLLLLFLWIKAAYKNLAHFHKSRYNKCHR